MHWLVLNMPLYQEELLNNCLNEKEKMMSRSIEIIDSWDPEKVEAACDFAHMSVGYQRKTFHVLRILTSGL